MKAIKSLLLIGFCMMSAGTVMGNVAFQVIGLVGCIVLLGFYFVIRRNERASKVVAQQAARQAVNQDMLIDEYNDLINAHIVIFAGTGKSAEQLTGEAMNNATAVMMDKYGYSAEELGRLLVPWQ